MNGVVLPFAAIAAGVVSASSPCVLPVLPGYIAAVSATSPVDDGRPRPKIIGALAFVAGFTLVFTTLGATASALGGLLYEQLGTALRVAGAILIVLGLHALGVLRWAALSRERRPIEMHRVGHGPHRAITLGASFALGWTPCIGPILATILTKAAANSSLTEGMLLLLLYSAGLGLPFVAVAIWLDKSQRPRRWITRRSGLLQRIGGLATIVVGVGYVSGVWATLFTGLQRWLTRTGWPPI